MAKAEEGWKVTAIAVRITDGGRVERPFEDFTPDERKETALRMNDRALRAAGYYPASPAPAAGSRRKGEGGDGGLAGRGGGSRKREKEKPRNGRSQGFSS